MTETTKEHKLITVLLGPWLIALILIVTFPLTMYCAWCDLKMWNWFCAPFFHLPQMSLWVAIGIGLWIRSQTFDHRDYEGQKLRLWRTTLGSLLGHTTALGIAFFIHSRFM